MLMHDWSWRYGWGGRRSGLGWRSRPQHRRWGRRLVAQRGVRACGIVVASPIFNHDLGLLERVEDLTFEQFIAELRVEALAVAILPRAAWLDVSRLGPHSRDPLPHGFGHEFAAVIGPNMARNTAQDEQVREHIDHINCLQLPAHPDGQALAGELVDDVEHAELAPVMGAILDKVIGPDMVGILWPQPDAGSVSKPEPSAWVAFVAL